MCIPKVFTLQAPGMRIYVHNMQSMLVVYSMHSKLRMFTFTNMVVRLESISKRALTMMTTFCVDTVMRTHAIVISTLIKICNNDNVIVI